MPVFFRAGCNSGGCHGAARGKDGFRLSLFGYDPDGDYFRLTQQVVGRRVDVASPEQSLLLAKATGKVTHTGGQLFKEDSPLLPDAPPLDRGRSPGRHRRRARGRGDRDGADPDGLRRPDPGREPRPSPPAIPTARPETSPALARFSTRTTRRRRRSTRTVGSRPAVGATPSSSPGSTASPSAPRSSCCRPSPASGGPTSKPSNYIDELVFARLQKLHLAPSDPCTDEQFLRRAHLDLIGLPPTVEEYRRFLADPRPDRRSRLVDELLKRDEFADLWAAKWGEALKILGVGYTPHASDEKAAEAYYEWIRDQMGRNAPLDEFVRAQLTAKGSNLVDGPVNLYTSLPQSVKFVPKDFAQDFAQLFTGIRIQCAECHNHPFDRWTMDDYYGLVSCFTGVTRKPGSEPREFYIYNDPSAPPAKHLLDDRPVPARVLGGLAPVPKRARPPGRSGRLADRRRQPLFRPQPGQPDLGPLPRPGDHRAGRRPPREQPAQQRRVDGRPGRSPRPNRGSTFEALVRDICTSRTYQASIVPNATNADDDRQFSRATPPPAPVGRAPGRILGGHRGRLAVRQLPDRHPGRAVLSQDRLARRRRPGRTSSRPSADRPGPPSAPARPERADALAGPPPDRRRGDQRQAPRGKVVPGP